MTVFQLMLKYDLSITRNLVEKVWHVNQIVLSDDGNTNLLPVEMYASDKSIMRAIREVIRKIKNKELSNGNFC